MVHTAQNILSNIKDLRVCNFGRLRLYRVRLRLLVVLSAEKYIYTCNWNGSENPIKLNFFPIYKQFLINEFSFKRKIKVSITWDWDRLLFLIAYSLVSFFYPPPPHITSILVGC